MQTHEDLACLRPSTKPHSSSDIEPSLRVVHLFYSWLEGFGQERNRKKMPLVALSDARHQREQTGLALSTIRRIIAEQEVMA